MKDLVTQIHQDHLNMARILKLIESEIEALVAEEYRDLGILNEAMRYMINYGDKIHHAKEDLMFERLREVAPQTRDVVDAIAAEHADIIKLGSDFHELVKAVDDGDFVLRNEIVQKGSDYVQTLYAHMRKEEEDILSEARDTLSAGDFNDVNRGFDADEDPVFGEQIQKQYSDLYDHILRYYGDDLQHPPHQVD